MAPSSRVVGLLAYHHTRMQKFYDDPKLRVYSSRGSSRSGKTYSAVQFLVKLCMNTKIKGAVMRFEGETVRLSIWEDVKSVLLDFNLMHLVKYTESTMKVVFPNGSVVTGMGMEANKLHGFKADVVIIDEIIDVEEDAYNQVKMRVTGKIFACYNPKYTKSWVYDRIEKSPRTMCVHSTYIVNSFLEPAIVESIEEYKPTLANIQCGTANQSMWDIYGLGKPSALEGAIFTKFKERVDWPIDGHKLYCLDWGYAHPTSLREIMFTPNGVWSRSLVYESKLTLVSEDPEEDTLIKRMASLGIDKNIPITCDSAYPSNIETLVRVGYMASGISKPAGSVEKGITLMQATTNYSPPGDPIFNEVEHYVWKENGKPPNILDDAIDSLRYGYMFMRDNAIQWKVGAISRMHKAVRSLNGIESRRRKFYGGDRQQKVSHRTDHFLGDRYGSQKSRYN